ncbi:MAG TPA: hypothetical protein PKC43_06580 [Phycisphaerales bacterium]|nr:hypothetical protein [Phycisphaerales bacterium]HMP37097.1 hypothetical protein [Phycisphaerales bacterium]
MKHAAKPRSRPTKLYVLERDGALCTCVLDQPPYVGQWLLVSKSHRDALRLARWLNENEGPKVVCNFRVRADAPRRPARRRPSLVGTVAGETIETLTAEALSLGRGVLYLAAWNDDGSPRWGGGIT